MKAREADVIEREIAPSLPMTAGGTVDVQVATARAYPRSITKFIQTATEMAILSPEIAQSCIYAIPRDGEMIEGPSARLAEIVASAWGNLRIQAGATEDDGRYVTARGEAWDVERNVAFGFEVKRRITNRSGKTYSDDMIATTGNAAASIALRNAVFKAVPSPFWRPIYFQCRKVIAGDAKTFSSRRDNALEQFGIIGVNEQRVCAALGLKGKADITLEHMVTLAGLLTSLKEGDTTIEEAFPLTGAPHGMPQPAQRVQAPPTAAATNGEQGSQQRPPADASAEARSREMPSAETGAVGGAAPSTAGPKADEKPKHIAKIKDIKDGTNGAKFIVLETDFVAASQDAAAIKDAIEAREAGVIVELVHRPPSNPRYAATLLQLKERTDLMEGQS